jgi:hypothetical protein
MLWDEPVPLHTCLPCCLEHVVADHSVVVKDHRVVGLDETHAPHVCCKIEDMVYIRANLLAVVEEAQVHEMKLITKHVLL